MSLANLFWICCFRIRCFSEVAALIFVGPPVSSARLWCGFHEKVKWYLYVFLKGPQNIYRHWHEEARKWSRKWSREWSSPFALPPNINSITKEFEALRRRQFPEGIKQLRTFLLTMTDRTSNVASMFITVDTEGRLQNLLFVNEIIGVAVNFQH